MLTRSVLLRMLLSSLAVCCCWLEHSAHAVNIVELQTAAHDLQPWLIAVRRELHKLPELKWEEHNTSALIRQHLEDMGIPYDYPYAETGVVGRIGKGKPIVALRSDMDALPVHEPKGLEFASQHVGKMHACGHDGHMTMLLGAAKLLKQRERHLQGTVLLVFQPAEEGGAGADVMIKQGAIDGASAAFAMHVWPGIPTGQLATRSGTLMAGSHTFELTVHGRGGHAAIPHYNIDPVPAAAALILALQTLVSRETSPLESAVLSVSQLQGSDANNITPDDVIMRGTVRCLTHEHMMYIKRRIEEMVPAVVSGYQCNATVDWVEHEHPYYPPTVNDPAAWLLATDVASKVLGKTNVLDIKPVMPAEDFAFFGRRIPSTMMFIGIRNETVGSVHNLHSPNFMLDESVLPLGAALHAGLAMSYLERQQEGFEDLASANDCKSEL